MISRRRFALALGLVAVGALVLRVGYVLAFRDQHTPFFGDALFYSKAATVLADGHWFVQPLSVGAEEIPAAEHPPLYIVWLAIPAFLTGGGQLSQTTQMLWSCLLGTGTVVLVGLAGRRIAGPWCGLTAAGLAAVYPNVWVHDGELLSETMAMFMVALIIVLAYRFVDEPTLPRALWLGAACGLSALSRPELILTVGLVLAPVVLLARALPVRRRLGMLGAGGAVAALVLAPWVVYNLSRFEEPVYLSVNFGATLSASNCDETYYGEDIGYKNYECGYEVYRQVVELGMDPSEGAAAIQDETMEYIDEHRSRVPVVVLARLGRIVGAFKPSTDLRFDQFVMHREPWIARSTQLTWYVMAPLAVVGAVLLRRRRVPILPLVAFPAIVLVTVAITFAQLRYRAPAEPAVVLLAAVTVTGLLGRLTPAGDRDDGEALPPGPAAPEGRLAALAEP
jgi:4-amino-4-deoxy-L-arabinose transferase-like glycosyltransferase